MALGEAELVRIGDYVKGNLRSWLQEVAPTTFTPDPVTNTQLLERIVHLEERFERADDRFEHIDERFEFLGSQMERRFQAVDKRFELMGTQMEERFKAVDKRFDDLIHHLDRRIGTVQWLVLAGLAAATLFITIFA